MLENGQPGEGKRATRPERAGPPAAWAVALAVVILLFGVAGHDLWTPDEPREAAMGKEMAAGHSWLVPRLSGDPFVEKPPFYYWVLAFSMRAIGPWLGLVAAARVVSAVFGALTLLVLWWAARRLLDPARARTVTAVLATMVGFVHITHWVVMDSVLMFFVTAAVLLMAVGRDSERPWQCLLAYLAAGLGFLTKGPIAWVLAASPWLYLLVTGHRAFLARPGRHLAGAVLLLGIAGAWAYGFYQSAGSGPFLQWFVDNQFGRFLGTARQLGHIHGPGYYFVRAPWVLLPWTPAVIGWLVHRQWREGGNPGERMASRVAAAWAFGGFLLLTLSGTKREIYLCPLLPGFAMVAAQAMAEPRAWVRWTCAGAVAALILATAVTGVISPWLDAAGKATLALDWKPLVLLLTAAAVAVLVRRSTLTTRLTAATALVFLGVFAGVVPAIDGFKSYRSQTESLARAIPPAARGRVCGFDLDTTSRGLFPFYADLAVPNITDAGRLGKILDGRDAEFDLVVTRSKRFPPEGSNLPPFRVLVRQSFIGERELLLLQGCPADGATEHRPESSH